MKKFAMPSVEVIRAEGSKTRLDLLLESKLLRLGMTDSSSPDVQLNCRISGYAMQDLKAIADACGQSVSSLAGEILEASIADWDAVFNSGEAGEE